MHMEKFHVFIEKVCWGVGVSVRGVGVKGVGVDEVGVR